MGSSGGGVGVCNSWPEFDPQQEGGCKTPLFQQNTNLNKMNGMFS